MNRALLTVALIALLSSTGILAKGQTEDLLVATADRDTARVNQLLAHGWDVDARDAYGNTALMIAAACDYADITAILVDAGADVNIAGRVGNSALIYAAQTGATEVARLLIEAGARVDVKNDFGNTALGLAAGYGHRDIIGLIHNAPTPTQGALALAF